MLTREDDAAGAACQQRPPRGVEARIDERVTAARPRISGPVADVYSRDRRTIHPQPAQLRQHRASAFTRQVAQWSARGSAREQREERRVAFLLRRAPGGVEALGY